MAITYPHLVHGKAETALHSLPKVHAIVTDPPYGLNYMGSLWDTGIPSSAFIRKLSDAVLPGGLLIMFCGTRKFFELGYNISRSEFEIIDTLGWVYTSGFNKSHGLPEGLSTTLKPSWEPIILARKRSSLSIKECYRKYGTGVLNFRDCMIGDEVRFSAAASSKENTFNHSFSDYKGKWVKGRQPANMLSDGALGILLRDHRRFFLCAKPNKTERKQYNKELTVKPVELMRWLCQLVTPGDGIVLDPFMGSGTTGVACVRDGIRFIGVEKRFSAYLTACRRVKEEYEAAKSNSIN
jgi:site-specific DNA-methyltransferase (adenine-specific)